MRKFIIFLLISGLIISCGLINRNINDTEGYRSVQVFIQGSEHIPPAPEKVPNLMNYFIN